MKPSARLLRFAASAASFGVFVLLWQLVAMRTSPDFLPTPLMVWDEAVRLAHTPVGGKSILVHAAYSLRRVLIAYGWALLLGLPLGLCMGWNRTCEKIVSPIFELLRPIPPIAWIPIAILWLGIGIYAKSFIIFLAAFVPCVINSYTGIRLANPVLIRVARIYGASNWETFLRIGVPSAIPMIFTGMKLSLNAAWTTLVAAELLAASQGLGYLIQLGRRLARPDVIIVGMLTIGLLGALMSWGLTRIEARFASSRRLT